MEFKTPFALLLIPIVLGIYFWARQRRQIPAFGFSSTQMLGDLKLSWRKRFGFIPSLLRLLALILICVALAGPRKVLDEANVSTQGIDIVLAIDSSGSMAAEDFEIDGKRKNRFEIVKKVVSEFIQMRPNDQLGLITFAGRAYTLCPLTTDRNWLNTNLDRMKLGMIEDGTAIGSGIASSVNRLKNSKAKSKIIVLLTDGVNNAGTVDPITAAKTATALGIKIYTIGAGSKGPAPFPVQSMWGQMFYQNVQIDIDEGVLTQVADLTKGKYFRATDTASLRNIYKAIDELEKTKIDQKGYKQYAELFYIFVVIALVLFAVEIILLNTVFFKIP